MRFGFGESSRNLRFDSRGRHPEEEPLEEGVEKPIPPAVGDHELLTKRLPLKLLEQGRGGWVVGGAVVTHTRILDVVEQVLDELTRLSAKNANSHPELASYIAAVCGVEAFVEGENGRRLCRLVGCHCSRPRKLESDDAVASIEVRALTRLLPCNSHVGDDRLEISLK